MQYLFGFVGQYLTRNRMVRFAKYISVLFAMAYFSCAPQLQQPTPATSPIVRVGIVQYADLVTFKPSGPFVISTRSKSYPISQNIDSEWQVQSQETAASQSSFRLYLSTHSTKQSAEKQADIFRRQGIRVEIITKGDELSVGNKKIAGSARYLLYAEKSFATREEAAAFQAKSTALQSAEIVTLDGCASGNLLISPTNGKTVEFADVVRLSGANFTIMDVQVGSGYHWSRKEDRHYGGEIELQIDDQGKITVINVLPMEEYLKGVLPGEMSANFPIEALKAQAIAARTFFLHGFGKKHLNDPFDVCANVHCQVFIGTASINKNIARAVDETRGIVILHDGKLCETPYSAICGGHTEFAQNVWASDGQPYLHGVYDVEHPEQFEQFDLSDENNVRKWIESRPKVFCNVDVDNPPAYAPNAGKYFRWQVEFSRQELQQQLTAFHKKSFGELLDIVEMDRGPSGRLKAIQIRGSEENFIIQKELNIRKALSAQTLYSACFVVDREGFSEGLPSHFIFKGAGWGHGVGMCQIGAAMMAELGKSAAEILQHYYHDIQFEQYYN